MDESSVLKEPLRSALKKYYQIDVYSPQKINKLLLEGREFAKDLDLVKFQLREAIDNNLISVEVYESLTDEDFDTQNELNNWLERCLQDLP